MSHFNCHLRFFTFEPTALSSETSVGSFPANASAIVQKSVLVYRIDSASLKMVLHVLSNCAERGQEVCMPLCAGMKVGGSVCGPFINVAVPFPKTWV